MMFGAAWTMSVRLVDKGIGLASTVFLARLLVPADFGVVAMAMGVVALLDVFSAFGFDTALIQRGNVDRSRYDTAWTFNIALGAFVATGLLVLAWPASVFFHQPALTRVLCALALASLLQGFENIGLVAFRRDLNFRAEFLIMTWKRLLLFGVTIGSAYWLRSYWALVIGMVLGRAIGVALSYVVHPYRPRLSLAARGELFSFSKWVLGTNLLSFALQRSSDLIIGRTLGPRELGLYNVSSELAALPASELVAPINRATYPGFARLADDRAALRVEYFTFIGFVAMIALPAAVGVASIAELVVPVVLGPNWLDAVDIVKICALGGTCQVIQSPNYGIYLAIGKPRKQVLINSIQLAVLLPTMIVLASLYGTKGAAVAFALSCAAVLPVNLRTVLPELKARFREFVTVTWRPLVGAVVMYTALQLWSPPVAALSVGEQLLLLIESIAAGVALYTLTVFICWLAGGQPRATETTIASKTHELVNHSIRWLLAR